MRIGFIGLGKMGAAIATNLLRAGMEVAVWNRSPGKTQPLLRAGAALAASPRDAAHGRDAVVTMLADDAALEAVVGGEDGILAGLGDGLNISMSTIAVATADRLAARHGAEGQRLVCAPVFGRPEAAAAAKLVIVAAGASADIDYAKPVFDAAGQRLFVLGTTASSANLVKLCGNFMILAAVEAMAEAMTLAQKGGVAKGKLLDIMTSIHFDAPVYKSYGKTLVEDAFEPAGFAAPLGLKDMRLVGESAETLRVAMPLLSVLRDHLLQTIAIEGDAVDWSAIGRTIAKNGGLPP